MSVKDERIACVEEAIASHNDRLKALEKKVSIIAEMIQPKDFKLHFNFREQIAKLKERFKKFSKGLEFFSIQSSDNKEVLRDLSRKLWKANIITTQYSNELLEKLDSHKIKGWTKETGEEYQKRIKEGYPMIVPIKMEKKEKLPESLLQQKLREGKEEIDKLKLEEFEMREKDCFKYRMRHSSETEPEKESVVEPSIDLWAKNTITVTCPFCHSSYYLAPKRIEERVRDATRKELIEDFQKILQEAHRKLNNVRAERNLSNYLIKQIAEYDGPLK